MSVSNGIPEIDENVGASRRNLASTKIESTHSEKREIAICTTWMIINVAEGFQASLYASDYRPQEATERTNTACGFQLVTKKEVQEALKSMKRTKPTGDDSIAMDISQEGEDITRKAFCTIF